MLKENSTEVKSITKVHLQNDALLEHRKAKQAYTSREQQYKRALEASQRVESRGDAVRLDKKRRDEEDAQQKVSM